MLAPEEGVIAVIANAGMVTVNPFVRVALCVSGFVITTSHVPAAAPDKGNVQVIWTELTTTTEAAGISACPVLTSLTAAPLTNQVPVRSVIFTLPAHAPEDGVIVVIVGAGSVYE